MLILSADVFDEVIVGNTMTWYSYAQFNSPMGAADSLTVMAYFTNKGAGTATINLFGDDSIDGRNWILGTAALISAATTITDGLLLYGFKSGAPGLNNSPGSFARFRFTLSGATPQCRLKLTATGRTL